MHFHVDPELISIRVHLPDETLVSVDKTPSPVTAGELVSRLISLPSVQVTGIPELLSSALEPIPNNAVLDQAEYHLSFRREEPATVRNFFFLGLFLIMHIAPIVFYRFTSAVRAIIVYIWLVAFFGLACGIWRPDPTLMTSSIGKFARGAREALWLLIRSFSPYFRLEHIILEQ